jgi:hypothetical protein
MAAATGEGGRVLCSACFERWFRYTCGGCKWKGSRIQEQVVTWAPLLPGQKLTDVIRFACFQCGLDVRPGQVRAG